MAVLIPHCPPGKILATIVSTHGGDARTQTTHAHAIDADGVRYFIFCNAIECTSPYTLEDLQVGSHVYGTPIQHPKGWRLLEVQVREL